MNILFTAHVKGHGAVEFTFTDKFQVCVVEVHRFVSYEKLVFPTYRPLSALMHFCATGVQPVHSTASRKRGTDYKTVLRVILSLSCPLSTYLLVEMAEFALCRAYMSHLGRYPVGLGAVFRTFHSYYSAE